MPPAKLTRKHQLPRIPCNGVRAFTVVEMLAAIALLSMISILLFTALNNITNITTTTMAKASIYQEGRTIIDQMGRELQQMMPYTIITATGAIENFTTEVVSPKKFMDWVAVIDNNEGHEEAEMHYYYDGSNTLYKAIVFYSNVVPDWDWNTNSFWRNTPDYADGNTFGTNFAPVLEGVRSVTFQLWATNQDPNINASPNLPVATWTGKTNEIPGYVRISIEAYPPNVIRRWKSALASTGVIGALGGVMGNDTNNFQTYNLFVHIPRSSE